MSTVEEIKQRLDILDIVGGYLRLEKAGSNFKALCPFHQEKTSSFFVFPDKQSWRCFGCGAGGDLIAFVMKKEDIDFTEALKLLADRAGVSLKRRKEPAEDRVTEKLYQINETAAKYYYDLLLQERVAKIARDYVENRGLSQKSVSDFQLGFSSGDGLKRYLMEEGYRESEIISSGLLREKDNGTYELFHHRLMFPIKDIKGKVVGFGARALDDSLPKYLNSPQTMIFDKGGIIYGIDRARNAIREKKLAVIVEGYMDVITAHQNGMTNVVASMGTALTEKQIKILKGITSSLAFALDPDVAGDAATLRGIEIARRFLDRENLAMPTVHGTTSKLRAEMRIISLPQGKDPDAVIREDPQIWQQLVDRALPLVEHLIAALASKFDLTRPEGKSRASEQILPVISELEDEVEREFYLGKLADVLGVTDRTLLEKVAHLHKSRPGKSPRTKPGPVSTAYLGDRLEEGCLALLLQHPGLRDKAEGLLADHFERSENREIFTAWSLSSNMDELTHRVSIELRDHLETLTGRALPPAGEKELEMELAACVRRLEERKLRLQDEIVTAEGVAEFSDGGELDSGKMAELLERASEVNALLVKKMQERNESNFQDRGN